MFVPGLLSLLRRVQFGYKTKAMSLPIYRSMYTHLGLKAPGFVVFFFFFFFSKSDFDLQKLTRFFWTLNPLPLCFASNWNVLYVLWKRSGLDRKAIHPTWFIYVYMKAWPSVCIFCKNGNLQLSRIKIGFKDLGNKEVRKNSKHESFW